MVEAARRVGRTRQAVHDIENGRYWPRTDTVMAFAEAYGVPLEHLLAALEDSISVDDLISRIELPNEEILMQRVGRIYGADRAAESRVPYDASLPPGAWEPEFVRIPILGRIHAGDPHWAEQHVEGWTTITAERARSGEFFALRVTGDCMAPARIMPGDIVIVRRQPTVEDGEIAVVWWNGEDEAHLRRVRRVDKQVLLTADNPAYPPVLLPPAKVTILGKVVEVRIEPKPAGD